MEVTLNRSEGDNAASQQELGSQQDATVSLANVSQRDEQKSDSDALDDLISTLAAVQKSMEKEDKVEMVSTTTEKQENESEISALSAEPVVIKPEMSMSEESPGNIAEISDNAESHSKGVPMEVDMPHSAFVVKPEKPEEPTGIEGTPDGTNGTFQQQADRAGDQVKDEVSGQPGLSSSPKDQAKAVEGSVASHIQLKKRFLSLMNDCMKALYLCQTRFPEHFKSLYRLAYICFYSVHYKVGLLF